MKSGVSLIIPTHGTAPFLRDALQSGATQTCAPDEIIVWTRVQRAR